MAGIHSKRNPIDFYGKDQRDSYIARYIERVPTWLKSIHIPSRRIVRSHRRRSCPLSHQAKTKCRPESKHNRASRNQTQPPPTLKTLRSLPVPRSVCANPCRDCIRTTNERSDLHVEGRSGTSSPCTSPGARLLANDEMAHAVANRLNGGTRVHNVALLLPRGHPK
jgi:hypothetical protein